MKNQNTTTFMFIPKMHSINYSTRRFVAFFRNISLVVVYLRKIVQVIINEEHGFAKLEFQFRFDKKVVDNFSWQCDLLREDIRYHF